MGGHRKQLEWPLSQRITAQFSVEMPAQNCDWGVSGNRLHKGAQCVLWPSSLNPFTSTPKEVCSFKCWTPLIFYTMDKLLITESLKYQINKCFRKILMIYLIIGLQASHFFHLHLFFMKVYGWAFNLCRGKLTLISLCLDLDFGIDWSVLSFSTSCTFKPFSTIEDRIALNKFSSFAIHTHLLSSPTT